MNPRVDLSKTSRFTIWESGFFNLTTQHGSAHIIANEDGEPLDMLFSADPTKYQHNCCFPASANQIVAYAHLINTSKDI